MAMMALYERAVAPYCPFGFMTHKMRRGRGFVHMFGRPSTTRLRSMFVNECLDYATDAEADADFYNEHAPRVGDLL